MAEDQGSQEHIVPLVQNVMSTVDLGCELNLRSIALRARNSEYNPKRISAVVMRIRKPKATGLIFASGKLVCMGADSEYTSKLAAHKFARIVQKVVPNAKVRFTSFEIRNIQSSTNVKFPIRLECLQMHHSAFSTYEPEMFPGLIYRMKQPKVTMLIFTSGKVVITGAKETGQLLTAFNKIYPVLCQFRKVCN